MVGSGLVVCSVDGGKAKGMLEPGCLDLRA